MASTYDTAQVITFMFMNSQLCMDNSLIMASTYDTAQVTIEMCCEYLINSEL